MRMDSFFPHNGSTETEGKKIETKKVHSGQELLDILKGDENLQHLEAFAKEKYGEALSVAIQDDEQQSVETRFMENFVRASSLSSVAALRAEGVLRTKA